MAVAITWVPLIVLGAIQGLAWGPTRAQSVVLDPAMIARFVIALPILILTASECSSSIDAVVRHFLEVGIVQDADRQPFVGMVATTDRFRNSRKGTWICWALAYSYSVFFVFWILPGLFTSWRALDSDGGRSLSLAGWWFVLVSEPLYLFVLARFLYQIALWWRFLWKTSRLNLHLNAVHPDGAGGLGFLGLTLYPFRIPAFAVSTSFAGGVASLVLIRGARVDDFRYEIVAIVLFVVCLFVLPLATFFHRELSRARQKDILSYWKLNGGQLRQFERKWIASYSDQADMLSVPDFSEAIDLSSILANAQNMTLQPFQRRAVIRLILAAALPFLPVLALQIPVSDILKAVLKMLG